ncbi:hypothetical protein B0T21DRAFT_442542 [Apiosordaria backusii]|uniref:Ecp2 effector protein domain-containing protein n=1 Tax=Apiosordaria backusii TaxID=314023 RepID=A0AA40BKA9_9PEZI|nr:hypothetical protein B0T21DRAFT_442542 [Apiosordaria backusii]
MKLFIITIAASALTFFGIAHGYGVPDVIPDVTWDMPINPADKNSATVSITGTIQKAVAKMEADYPGWNATLMARGPSYGGARLEQPIRYDCNVKVDDTCEQSIVYYGAAYLLGMDGNAKNGPGPENCGRVSCSYNAAIIWCNNNNEDKEVEWWRIGRAAAMITRHCGAEFAGRWDMKGHADFEDGWRVERGRLALESRT